MDDNMAAMAANIGLRPLQVERRRQEFADASQVAALSIAQNAGMSPAYQFTAARNAVLGWVYEFLWGNHTRRVGDYKPMATLGLDDRMMAGQYRSIEEQMIARDEDEIRQQCIDAAADTILEIMLSARTQRRGRAVVAAVRDTNIILLLLQGHSYEGIALELGINRESVRNYARQARARIEAYLVSMEDSNE